MVGTYKKFDNSLFNENDNICRDKILLHLSNLGIKATTNPDVYGPDLISCYGYIEVERKHIWDKDKFPFDSIQIPERKGKWSDKKIEFWVLNKDLTKACIIDGKLLTQDRLVKVDNKFKTGEYFYSIEISLCKFVDLS